MIVFTFILFLILPYSMAKDPYIWCEGQPADILFLIDSSTSVYSLDYKEQLKFLAKIVSIFPISETEIRIGLAVFSHIYYPIFDLTTYNTKEEVISAILRVPHIRGNTWTDVALKRIRTRGFRNARKQVPKILIVFTDGESRNWRATAKQAEILKQMKNVYIFAIGIGKAPKEEELIAIGSEPSKNFVFKVANYSFLDNIMKTLAYKACRVQSAMVLPYCAAKRPTDVMFAFDAGGIGKYREKFVNDFICNATGYFGNMDDGSLRAGVMEGKCDTQDIYLHDFNNKEDMIAQMKRESSVSKGLDHIINDMCSDSFNVTRGGREDSKKIAIVFVDETVNNMDDVAQEIVLARSKLIEVFVVVIGEHDNLDMLYAVVDEPPEEHITFVEDHRQLQSVQDNFSHMLCKHIEKEPPMEKDKYVDVNHNDLG